MVRIALVALLVSTTALASDVTPGEITVPAGTSVHLLKPGRAGELVAILERGYPDVPWTLARFGLSGTVWTAPLQGLTPWDVCIGPDGAVWFVAKEGAVGRAAEDGTVRTFPISGFLGWSIVVGPDNVLWSADFTGQRLLRIGVDGRVIGEVRTEGSPRGLAIGPDGKLWFSLSRQDEQYLGRIEPDGRVTLFGRLSLAFWVNRLASNDAGLWAAGEPGAVLDMPASLFGLFSEEGERVFSSCCVADGSVIAAGPDAAGWAPGCSGSPPFGCGLLRYSRLGELSVVPAPRTGYAISVASDGNLWYGGQGRILRYVLPPFDAIVPAVVSGAGALGSSWRTELTLTNWGTSEAEAKLLFEPSSPAGATASVVERLAPGRQLVVRDVVDYLRTHGVTLPEGDLTGALRTEVRSANPSWSVHVGTRTTTPSGQGRAGVGYGSVDLERAAAARKVRVFGLRETDSDRSNLGLVNVSKETALTLRVTLVSGDRAAPKRVVLPDVTLGPGERRQLDRVLAPHSLTNAWAEVERVSPAEGATPFAAYAVVNDNVTNDGSWVDQVEAGRTPEEQVVPVVVEAASYKSELLLGNPGPAPVYVTLSYVESLGRQTGPRGSVDLTILPEEQRWIPDVLAYLRQRGLLVGLEGETHAGLLRVRFEVPEKIVDGFVGARTFTTSPGGGRYGLFYAGVPLSKTAKREARVLGLRQDGEIRSNLAIENVSRTADVTLRYVVFDGDTGEKRGESEPITIAPGEWRQVVRVLERWGITNGHVKVTRDSGSANFLAYGVVNDGANSWEGTGDGTFEAMAGVK